MPDVPAIRDSALDHMKRVYDGLTEGLTGIGISDRKDWILSIGYLLQRQRGKQFLDSLMHEWEKYREKGRIKEDYATTEQCQASLQEILDCLDRDSPDEIRFSFLKKLFISIATEELSNRESPLPQQYIRIARGLSSGEVLVLLAAYGIAKSETSVPGIKNAEATFVAIAEKSGLFYPELVRVHQEGLVARGLFLWSKYYEEGSGSVAVGPRYRLTDLGFEICKFIERYDVETAGERKEG
jgi:hypothetical protein